MIYERGGRRVIIYSLNASVSVTFIINYYVLSITIIINFYYYCLQNTSQKDREHTDSIHGCTYIYHVRMSGCININFN